MTAGKHDGSTPTWAFCDSTLSARRVGDQPTTRAHFQDDRHGMAAVIRITAPDDGKFDVSVTFVHAKRDNRAPDTGQTLYLWILDDEGIIWRGDAQSCTVIAVPAEPCR